MDSMCCVSNKALGMGLLTPPSVLYYSYSTPLTITYSGNFFKGPLEKGVYNTTTVPLLLHAGL